MSHGSGKPNEIWRLRVAVRYVYTVWEIVPVALRMVQTGIATVHSQVRVPLLQISYRNHANARYQTSIFIESTRLIPVTVEVNSCIQVWESQSILGSSSASMRVCETRVELVETQAPSNRKSKICHEINHQPIQTELIKCLIKEEAPELMHHMTMTAQARMDIMYYSQVVTTALDVLSFP